MKQDPEQIPEQAGWTLRRGSRPHVWVAEHEKFSRRIYMGSPAEILKRLTSTKKGH